MDRRPPACDAAVSPMNGGKNQILRETESGSKVASLRGVFAAENGGYLPAERSPALPLSASAGTSSRAGESFCVDGLWVVITKSGNPAEGAGAHVATDSAREWPSIVVICRKSGQQEAAVMCGASQQSPRGDAKPGISMANSKSQTASVNIGFRWKPLRDEGRQ